MTQLSTRYDCEMNGATISLRPAETAIRPDHLGYWLVINDERHSWGPEARDLKDMLECGHVVRVLTGTDGQELFSSSNRVYSKWRETQVEAEIF